MILFCESEVNLWNVQTVGQDAPVLKAVKQSMKQSRRLTLECCARDLWNIQVWPNSVYDLERTEAAQKNCAADAHKVIRRKRKTRFKGDFKHQLGCHQSGIMFNNNLLWQGTTNLMGRSGNCVNKTEVSIENLVGFFRSWSWCVWGLTFACFSVEREYFLLERPINTKQTKT